MQDRIRDVYPKWINAISRRGVSQPAALILRACSPLAFLFSQLLYFSQPFLGSLMNDEQQGALTALLEDGAEYRRFIALLDGQSTEYHD